MIPLCKRENGFVYVVEACNGLVKIGWSLKPETRVAIINCHSPIPCRLVAMWKSPLESEMQWHRTLAACRHHNEWYENDGAVADLLSAVRGLGVKEIPDWDSIAPTSRAARVAEGRMRGRAKQSKAMKDHWANKKVTDNAVSFRDFLPSSPEAA